MLTKLEIKNYKSICNATIELSPFTLLIGANGAGKSNFIHLLKKIHDYRKNSTIALKKGVSCFHIFQQHFSHIGEEQSIKIENSFGDFTFLEEEDKSSEKGFLGESDPLSIRELFSVDFFSLDPSSPGKNESLVANPRVHSDGTGVVQVLDSLKTGDREDLFFKIEQELSKYVPEIEKLIFISGNNSKSLQVREKHIPTPIPVKDLSEGTRFILIILTILYQESPPSLICIEDIDRGFHPRLFQQVIELCDNLSRERDIQIIATTHNPYILDEFLGKESAVVIVEKKEGCTTFTSLAERLTQLESNGVDEEMPLGSLWYSGLVGGVPRS